MDIGRGLGVQQIMVGRAGIGGGGGGGRRGGGCNGVGVGVGVGGCRRVVSEG